MWWFYIQLSLRILLLYTLSVDTRYTPNRKDNADFLQIIKNHGNSHEANNAKIYLVKKQTVKYVKRTHDKIMMVEDNDGVRRKEHYLMGADRRSKALMKKFAIIFCVVIILLLGLAINFEVFYSNLPCEGKQSRDE